MSEIEPAFVLPIRVIIAGGARRQGWRATLQSGNRAVWRCNCRPHASYDAAKACGDAALLQRQRHSDQRDSRRGEAPTSLSRGDRT